MLQAYQSCGTVRCFCFDSTYPFGFCLGGRLHAAGYLPVGLWGAHVPISKARAYLPSYACSLMQSVLELECDGAYDSLDAVLFCVPCDTLRCISQIWKGKAPSITFTHPQNRRIAAANDFLAAEYDLVRSKLEKILKTKISDEAIEKSIEISLSAGFSLR
jgi:benzoyl-CoA reductase/2-hydroxyglutaryl-CoA dehydratase subunit BcrC/BadD/HgdB